MTTSYKLSEGALQVIMRGGEYHNPIVQVLGIKKINSGMADKERYRMLLSDGKNTISFAMLTVPIKDATCGGNGIPIFSVIQINKHITSVINNSNKRDTRVLLILDLKIIAHADQVGERIGSPTPFDIDSVESKAQASNTTSTSVSVSRQETSDTIGLSNSVNANGTFTSNQLTHPISSLSPYHNKWVIKARVTNKSAVRTWSNSKGEGKLFSVDLLDESGEIRLTGFKEAVDKFYEYLQVDKVYYISRCQLKPANKQFTSLKNDYEMTMTTETVIQECLDDDNASIPQVKYDFVTIDKIANLEPNSMIDVIAVIKNVGDLQTFQAKSTGKELKKKEAVLVDQSNTAITLTLWGTEAENFDGSNNPVIVLKGARVTEFGGGKNVSTLNSTQLKINPVMPECYRIRQWYDTEGNHLDATNLSARTGSGSMTTPWMSFKEVQEQGLGNGEKGDYYQVLGTILLMRSENMIYKACPSEECNKKVIDLENGIYRCEKCSREYPNFKYRLLASMNVGDFSGNQWISMFSSEVEKILGMSAQAVGELAEQNPEALAALTDKCNFKQFVLKCRAKMETYNDEARLKTVCIKVDDINYEEHNAYLLDRIDQFLS